MLPTTYPANPHLIFATNFSDACHAAIPMVAQWVDSLQARLTLLHVHAKGTQAQSARSLDSFFAEAAHYPGSERRLLSGRAADGIAEFCREHPQSMLVMPPSARTYLPRPLHVSLRAQVLRQVATPMLTLPYTDAIPEPPAVGGQVACWITGEEKRFDHVREAAALARRRDAELHLLHVLPEISEGLLVETLYSDRPLAEPAATQLLDSIVSQLGNEVRVRIHVGTGHTERTLSQLLQRSRANVLVVDRDTAVRKRLLRSSFRTSIHDNPCLLICVPPRGHDDERDPMLPPPNARERLEQKQPERRTVQRHRPVAARKPSSMSGWPSGLVPA